VEVTFKPFESRLNLRLWERYFLKKLFAVLTEVEPQKVRNRVWPRQLVSDTLCLLENPASRERPGGWVDQTQRYSLLVMIETVRDEHPFIPRNRVERIYYLIPVLFFGAARTPQGNKLNKPKYDSGECAHTNPRAIGITQSGYTEELSGFCGQQQDKRAERPDSEKQPRLELKNFQKFAEPAHVYSEITSANP
jgi:hypothetical protein